MSELRAGMRRERWLIFAFLFVAIGIWLRTRRFFGDVIPLWGDEAHWAIQLLTTSLETPSIRPVGFMAVSKLLTNLWGPTEVALRFLPWLAGVGSAVVSVPLARRLFRRPSVRLLFVAVIALHPLAIDLSKEFKPYTISLFLHMCCVLCAASYWDLGKARWLVGTIATSLVGVLFAQDLVFAYPALYLVLGIAALRGRRYQHVLLAVVGVLMTLGLLGLLYWYFWRFVGGPGSVSNKRVSGLASAWWSSGYDLFYLGKNSESQLDWLARKFADLASFASLRRNYWSPLGPLQGDRLESLIGIDRAIWTLLQLVGLISLIWRKRVRDVLLLVLPQVAVLGFNLLKLWPLAAFRTDLFLLLYTAAVGCAALDQRHGTQRTFRQLFPTALLVIAPLLLFERNWHRNKDSGGELLAALDAVTRLQGAKYSGPRELLVLDGYLCVVWRYYQDFHPGHGEQFQDLRRRFLKQCVKPWNQRALLKAQRVLGPRRSRFWLLLARPPEIATFASTIPGGYVLVGREDIYQGQSLVVGLRRR